jgi:FAD/FMN-containing dehydrogenase
MRVVLFIPLFDLHHTCGACRGNRIAEPDRPRMPPFNDVHSQLNPAQPSRVAIPYGVDELAEIVGSAVDLPIAVCAGRHAMGGQQFIDGGLQLDMQAMDQLIEFDPERGLLSMQAGMQWPALMAYLDNEPDNPCWGIRQKQTGADRFSLGGSLAANIHGRGLQMPPLVADIEAFSLVDASGRVRRCSRALEPELFSLAIGGYGLFGIVADVTLRLARHYPVTREVELITIEHVLDRLDERSGEDCRFGDFQFSIDNSSADFLSFGILSCYRRLPAGTPLTVDPLHLADADWTRLLHLAHVDKARAFEEFRDFYLRSHGQIYRSDTHQAGYYLDGYHGSLDGSLAHQGSEVISELYVPRDELVGFMADAARELRELEADVVYGTVRLVERDSETVLAWAREAWACVIFNLHTAHTAEGMARTARCNRFLLDLALAHGGSYYLTYHRDASPEQLRQAHPRFEEFVEAKQRWDPNRRFLSNWYRHYTDGGST